MLIENQDNRERKWFIYTKYRRNNVHAICEKVTRRENCSVKPHCFAIIINENDTYIHVLCLLLCADPFFT